LGDRKDYVLSQEETEENRIKVARDVLNLMHKNFCAQERYFYLRKKGIIEENKYFEPGE